MKLKVFGLSQLLVLLVCGISDAAADRGARDGIYIYSSDTLVCQQGSGDDRIAACTRDIESGHWQGIDLALAYNNRAAAKSAKGEFGGAIADTSRAIELNPKYGKAYSNRGVAKYGKGDIDGAIEDFNSALEYDARPEVRANAYSNRGTAKMKKGDRDGALADYNRAIELDPHLARKLMP